MNWWDFMVFVTAQDIYRPTWLVQWAANSVSTFVSVSWKIHNVHQGSTADSSFSNVSVPGQQSQYWDELNRDLPSVQCIVVKCHQSLGYVLVDVKRVVAHISELEYYWCCNTIQLVRLMNGGGERCQVGSNTSKVWNLPQCKNHTKCRA